MTEQIEVVRLVTTAKAWMLYVLLRLVLLLQLRLGVNRRGEVCERVGEVVTGEATPVRRHRGYWLAMVGGIVCGSCASVCLRAMEWNDRQTWELRDLVQSV